MTTYSRRLTAAVLGLASLVSAQEVPVLQFTHEVKVGEVSPESCGGSVFSWGRLGDPVVQCFGVVNTGTNTLDQVVVEVPSLGASHAAGRMLPGQAWFGRHASTLLATTSLVARVSASVQGAPAQVFDQAAIRLQRLEDCPFGCLALADVDGDGGPDRLYHLDLATGHASEIGLIRPDPEAGLDANCLKSLVVLPSFPGQLSPLMFAVDAGPSCDNGPIGNTDLANQGRLGRIEWLDAATNGTVRWLPLPHPLGVGRGAFGLIPFNEVEGLAFGYHYSGGRGLYLAIRQAAEPDLLALADPDTGRLVPDAFGLGLDYVPLQPVTNLQGQVLADVEDILVDNLSGAVWAAYTGPGLPAELARVNPENGRVLEHAPFVDSQSQQPIQGVADIDFGLDGTLHALTSTSGVPARTLFQVSLQAGSLGAASAVGGVPGEGDLEAMACFALAPDAFVTVQGQVVVDLDQDGRADAGETAPEGLLVFLWVDANSDRRLDPVDDFFVDQFEPTPSGAYSFILPINERYFVLLETGTPSTVVCGYTTPIVHEVLLTDTCNQRFAFVPDMGVVVCADRPDGDGDGLPDGYEAAHGLSPVADNRGADADSDRLADEWEYLSGTPPRLAGTAGPWLAQPGGRVVAGDLSFLARRAQGPGYEGLTRYYTLEHRADLSPGPWQPVSGFENIPGWGQVLRVPLPGSSGFLRARIELR